jgi:predicted enzyme related to lactoylglutathione lyase
LSAALVHHHRIFNEQEYAMTSAISWFEIPTQQLDKAQAFYEAVLQRPMRREAMGSSLGAVFAYSKEQGGIGGALMMGPTAPQPSGNGARVYLDASPSLDAALQRVVEQGGGIALGCQALPPGMGFFAHITDLDGNCVGLHALA